ncbi:YheC/YheD family endospore coat-associated protein [Paenibacillus roseipurpureus]|uniref:YheC/YheD family protein n=1 Tax=Paenibacillus roseopurpureus TaxID=2918901 RepID=A0AA96LK44_9BACL|nr:YheC/YheD family protein [Paenibacillus sp. MBLB1832]WNR43367.1 YheC/YheD family protein [Paenibacillus sp. MBLB1832]
MFLQTHRPLLGIMVTELQRELPFASSSFYQNLTICGRKQGIDVFVFSPNRINWGLGMVRGYCYEPATQAWTAKMLPLPTLVYDRCFFATKQSYLHYQHHVRKLRDHPSVRFLGYGLSGKWEVGQILQKDPALQKFLPKTYQLKDRQLLDHWFGQHTDAFLKPQGGSQGIGAMHLRKHGNTFHIQGRDGRNQPFEHDCIDEDSCWAWLKKQIGSRPYLLQQYLTLQTMDGMAYDVRSLVQKNGKGTWEITGMAVRMGKRGSITSNLHGGGSTEEATTFLTSQFGAERTNELMETMTRISRSMPSHLEAYHGRLVELGIDFGIDTSGRIWILEVNSKPGRTIFARLGNERARIKSIANPIQYAGFLLNKQLSVSRLSPV